MACSLQFARIDKGLREYRFLPGAPGRAGEDSDLDLVVVSDSFRDMDLWERLCFLGRARKGINRPMEILGLTEEEFELEGKGTFIGNEVKSKGIEVNYRCTR